MKKEELATYLSKLDFKHYYNRHENEYYYLVITIFMIILGILKLGAGVFIVFQYIYTKNVVLEIFGAIRILFTSILCYFLFKIKI